MPEHQFTPPAVDDLLDIYLQRRLWVVQPYSKYLIVYDPATKPLRVIRIPSSLRGARHLPGILI
jgi:hypothetical protein